MKKGAVGEGGGGEWYWVARKLESEGVWRTWLGDSLYSSFHPSLSSPSTWNSFFLSDSKSTSTSTSTSDIHLQLRVRALLFDKALSLSSSSSLLNLTPSDVQLHGDDVYYTLDEDSSSSSSSSEELFPETWYTHFIRNYTPPQPHLVSHKRTPSGMSAFLNLSRKKRTRLHSDSDSDSDSDSPFFPETMFIMNSVPDSALPPTPTPSSTPLNAKPPFNGVLDTLPKLFTKTCSSIMLERLGIRPDYLPMENPIDPTTDAHLLAPDQAIHISNKIVARLLTNLGFEASTQLPIQVLSQFLTCHVSKLGSILKLLADTYKKQCSAVQLIKMFLQAGGISLSSLAEHVKDTRPAMPTPQQIPQLPSPQHNTLQLPQQVPRQVHPQIQQMVRPNNLTPQQLEMLRRRQASSPRPVMNMDNNRPMVEVKLENAPELPIDNNRLAQNQWRQQQQQQQQFAALQRFGHQVRQPTSMQMPPMQIPSIGAVRAQPVKVEGFQELMGGDSSSKQNADDNKLTSPSK